MPHSNQDCRARRFQSFDTENPAPRYDNGYDCELPPDMQSELGAPRRPRILGRKTQSKLNLGANWPLYLVPLIAIVVVGATIATWRQEQNTERTNKAISQPLAPQPTPSPITLPPGSASRCKEYLANNPPAPRATLVKLLLSLR
jgi:hypothetical protein